MLIAPLIVIQSTVWKEKAYEVKLPTIRFPGVTVKFESFPEVAVTDYPVVFEVTHILKPAEVLISTLISPLGFTDGAF